MKKIAIIAIALGLGFTSCKPKYQKTKDGMEYQIFEKGSGEKIKQGDFIQFHVTNLYNNGKIDSVINDTRETFSPVINPVDSAAMGPYFEIFTKMRKGDSLSIRTLTDSLMKNMMGQVPPFMQKGHWTYTTVKVIDVFKDTATANAAAQKMREEQTVKMEEAEKKQLVIDEKIVTDYLKKNNIQAQRSPEGAYVQILQPGSGPNIDTSVVAVVNYTGKDMATGETFDSNTDPAFKHVMPLSVNMTDDPRMGGRVIKGWSDALKMLNKGAKAKLFIPSALAYGKMGNDKIKPNSNLMFDVEITDVLNKEQAKQHLDKQMEEMQKQRQHMMDSITAQSKVSSEHK